MKRTLYCIYYRNKLIAIFLDNEETEDYIWSRPDDDVDNYKVEEHIVDNFDEEFFH